MDFKEVLLEFLKSARIQPGQLMINHDPERMQASQQPLPPIDLFQFSAVQGKIEWVFVPVAERPWGGSTKASMVGQGGRLSYKEMESVRHDLACNLLFGSAATDVKLSTIASLNQASDNLTPDAIFPMDNAVMVVEVGTTQSSQPNAVLSLYREKLNKYSGYLTEMAQVSGKCIIYVVIAIGMNEVCCSIGLPKEMANDLIYRVRMGIRFERAYQASGLRKVVENQESPQLINLRSAIGAFGDDIPRNGSIPGFDGQAYDEWSTYKPDASYLEEMEDFVMTETVENMISLSSRRPVDQVIAAFNYLDTIIAEQGGVRQDEKSPIQMPFIIPEALEGSKPTCEVVPNEASELMEVLELWDIATMDALQNQDRFEQVTIEEEEHIAMVGDDRTEEEKRASRKLYHRVSVKNLSTSSKASLALDGFQAKKMWKKPELVEELKERRLYTQTSFSPHAETQDIEDCLTLMPQPEDISIVWPEWASVERLLAYANNLAGNSSTGLDTVKAILNTDVCSGLVTIAAIASELAVSHRQNCRADEMIYKRLNGVACELLIYPTNSTSHIFFSVRAKGKLILGEENSTFRKMVKVNGWYYTPMLSVDSSRLENMIKCPFTWINSIIHWRIWYGQLAKEDMGDWFSSKEEGVVRLTWLTTLISLEDKSTTEELASSVRYIGMQFFKGSDPASPLNLEGSIRKMPTVLRSRLAVRIYNMIREWALTQAISLPVFNHENLETLKEDRNGDNWSNLICPYIMEPVTNCQSIIQVFYLSYAKNKNTSPSENSDYALVHKILQHGNNKDPRRVGRYTGKEEPSPNERPGPHEFSKNAFAAACQEAKKVFMGAEGREYKKHLEDKILNELIHKASYEAMGTLKASFNYDEETLRTLSAMADNEDKISQTAETQGNRRLESLLAVARSKNYLELPMNVKDDIARQIVEEKKKNKLLRKISSSASRSKSCKCVEAVVKAMADLDAESCLPLDSIATIYNRVLNSWGGICCYLFKKNQHGGIREIYVLTFYSRILQLFVETVGRVLCSYFPMETMTHPNEKSLAIQSHFGKVKSQQMGDHRTTSALTRASSEDKSKWSQNNNVSCYAFIAAQVLPTRIAKAVMRILQLWKTKKILLPDGVRRMLENDLEKPDDSTYELLRSEYWGRSPLTLLDRVGGGFLKTDTGMWQGILHYFSSFQHVLQILSYKQMFSKVITPQLQQAGVVDYELTHLVSSDDSLTLLTVLVGEAAHTVEQMTRINRIMSVALHAEDLHSSFFMMNESPKSCMASTTVFEFNSVFHIAQGSVSPVVKKVLCCTNIIQSESFITKFRSTYNAVKDILEEGGCHFQVHLHQLVCGMLHYFILGSCTTSLFKLWAESILKDNPNPHVGFFILDIDLMAGLCGYEFTQYNSLRLTTVPVILSQNLMQKFSKKGSFSNAVAFLHGNRTRWQKLKDRILELGWEESIDRTPEVLYKAYPETAEEARLRLSMKVCSKGVYEALVVGGKLSAVVASTVYMIREPVMTVRSTDYDDNVKLDDLDRKTAKLSLLRVTRDMASPSKEITLTHIDMDDHHKSLYYQNHKLYEDVIRMVEVVRKEVMEVETIPYRKVKNNILLRTLRANSKIPLMSCCRKIWFKMPVKHSSTVIADSWAYYKSHFPWLHEDINITLDRSPFCTHTEMYRFIQGMQDTTSSVRILCKRFSSNQTYGKIRESMLFNQYPGIKLVLSGSARKALKEDTAESVGSTRELQSMLNLLLSHPRPWPEKLGLFEEIIMKQGFEFSDHMLLGLNQIECRQVVLIAYLAGLPNSTVIELLSKVSGQMVSFYSIPQRRDHKGRWSGYGCLTMAFKEFRAELHFVDDILVFISSTDVELLRINHILVIDEMAKAGVKLPSIHKRREFEARVPNHIKEHLSLNNRPYDYCFTNQGLSVRTGLSTPYPPVYSIRSRELMSNPDNLDLWIDYKGEQIELMASSVESGQATSLCKFYPLNRVRPVEDLAELWDWAIDEDEDFECWLFNVPRSVQSLIDDIHGLRKDVEREWQSDDDRAMANKRLHFMRQTLLHRATFRNKLSRTYRLKDLEEATSALLEPEHEMTEMDLDLYSEAFRETASVAKAIAAESPKRRTDEATTMTRQSPVKGCQTTAWVDKLAQFEPSNSDTGSILSNLRHLEERMGAGIRVDEGISSIPGELQPFYLHHYWDSFITRIDQFGVWKSFREETVLPESLQPTCEILSWLLDRECYGTYASVPF